MAPLALLFEIFPDAWYRVLELLVAPDGVGNKQHCGWKTAHTIALRSLQSVTTCCKGWNAWNMDWKALCKQRWPAVALMAQPGDHFALFKMLSHPMRSTYQKVLNKDFPPYVPSVRHSKPIKYDPEMRELQLYYQRIASQLETPGFAIEHVLDGGTMDGLTSEVAHVTISCAFGHFSCS